MKNINKINDLVFVGYTNGDQILYAKERNGGEGAFYSDTENECYIPLYMLKAHIHRIETTSKQGITLSQIIEEK